MARQSIMCNICKLDKAGICNYECIKNRFRLLVCPNFIYNNGKSMTNAELLSTDIKTDTDLGATNLWYKLVIDDSFDTLEQFIEWLHQEITID